MARSTVQSLADRVLGGNLQATLIGWQDSNLTIDQITRKLSDDHGIVVSRETVRRWIKSYGEQAA